MISVSHEYFKAVRSPLLISLLALENNTFAGFSNLRQRVSQNDTTQVQYSQSLSLIVSINYDMLESPYIFNTNHLGVVRRLAL